MDIKSKRQVGYNSEEKVISYLHKQNWQIIDINVYISKLGEIDIIAIDKSDLVFVEVRTVSKNNLHTSLAISKTKLKRLILLANHWIYKNNYFTMNSRIDLIVTCNSNPPKILEHYLRIDFS